MPFLRVSLLAVCALALIVDAASAQEPVPSRLQWSVFESGEAVQMTRAWKFRAGDDARWRLPAIDDGDWEIVDPRMPAASRPRGGWQGIGWFRRHVVVDAATASQPILLRVEAPGHAVVFVDGTPVAESIGRGRSSSGSWTSLRLTREGQHVIAVRYVCRCVSRTASIGFVVSLERPGASGLREREERRSATLYGFFTAIPAVLGALHLALFAFYPRRRENLFCSLCMLSLALIVGASVAQDGASDAAAGLVVTLLFAGVIGATFFGLMTYLQLRVGRIPRSWILFAVAGALLLIPIALLDETAQNVAWSLYFAASIVEIARVETKRISVSRTSATPLLIGMLLLDGAIVVQILIAFDVIAPPFGFNDVYLLGILAFSFSTSFFVARSFAQTSLDLERRLEEVQTLSAQVIVTERESTRRGMEIEAARTLQRSILPTHVPQLPHLQLAAGVTTATEVGGDYYDFRVSADHSLVVAIGDAAGHGVAAGTMVTATKALFSSLAGETHLPAILAQCDRVLRGMNVRPLHMCLLLARITPQGITVASAAMPRPLHFCGATGRVSEIEVSGMPLAAALSSAWAEESAVLETGDALLFASDGLAEALSPDDEPFGYERVAESFRSAADKGDATAILEALKQSVESWRGGRARNDDAAAVVVRIT